MTNWFINYSTKTNKNNGLIVIDTYADAILHTLASLKPSSPPESVTFRKNRPHPYPILQRVSLHSR